jgi:methylthioribulose-1-phosphate dehydratase
MDLREGLSVAARTFYHRNWMVGTAGNLSARLKDGSFWITASSCQKGSLGINDFVRIELVKDHPTGYQLVEGDRKPSAETSIHGVIYQLFPQVMACLHVHSIDGNLASLLDDDFLSLPTLEMIKGLGIWVENPQVFCPIFPNHFVVEKIAAEIYDYFCSNPPQIPALLIRNHGVTVWGESLTEAINRLEIMEYIFSYIISAKKAGIPLPVLKHSIQMKLTETFFE